MHPSTAERNDELLDQKSGERAPVRVCVSDMPAPEDQVRRQETELCKLQQGKGGMQLQREPQLQCPSAASAAAIQETGA